jgi:hypothetical protein
MCAETGLAPLGGLMKLIIHIGFRSTVLFIVKDFSNLNITSCQTPFPGALRDYSIAKTHTAFPLYSSLLL